jgi:hypothetical protein
MFIFPLNLRQFMLLVFMAQLSMGGWAQNANSVAEYRVKAAYIYNFAKYVDWPGDEGKPFRVCTAGKDDLGGALSALDRRTAQGREIQVRRDVALEQLKECQIAFVGDTDGKLLNQVMRQLNGSPVLVVSDLRQAADSGVHILLQATDDRVEFDVNLATMQKANLKASSQMLKLARSTKSVKP